VFYRPSTLRRRGRRSPLSCGGWSSGLLEPCDRFEGVVTKRWCGDMLRSLLGLPSRSTDIPRRTADFSSFPYRRWDLERWRCRHFHGRVQVPGWRHWGHRFQSISVPIWLSNRYASIRL